ncbi:MAG: hypoxanthine phosphoribosyltransferase [Dehalogenimonas sp.]|uniref:Hypoxanthine phosphoribosyltransferase n=1 Tax=Candidatus Dehalogenimonas loeffleri TaxID=3127115 RepID=A0ABZ2J2Q5_9CHLR|nr:hypoxanthine phosphoribosyltransferase [Dehalogenimonas sp.]
MVDTKQTSVYNAGVPELKLLYTRHDIEVRIKQLASRISDDYNGRSPLVIGVLKGAVIFLADLVREIELPLEIDFIGMSSYGSDTTTCGQAVVTSNPTAALDGRDIIIVEDIVDTGICLKALREYLASRHPASVRVCALLDKPSRRRVPVAVDYAGFEIPDKFVVGYGLDCAQRYRNLPAIYTLEDNDVREY